MRKQNLVLMTILVLVIVMTLCVVNAWPWSATGNAIIKSGDEINVYGGEDREFEMGNYSYKISEVKITENEVSFQIENLDTYGTMYYSSTGSGAADSNFKGMTIPELIKIDKQWWNGKYRARVKISVAKSSTSTFGCSDSDGYLAEESYYVKGSVRGYWKDSTTSELEPDGCCTGCEVGMSIEEIRKTETTSFGTGKNVIEVFCGDDGYIDAKVGSCPYGCKDGACVSGGSSRGGGSGVGVTYAGVLEMLNKCDVVNVDTHIQKGEVQTGDDVCSFFGEICIYNFIGFDPEVTVSGNTNQISRPISCDDATNNYPTASWAKTICCTP